jgi:hypothetical protein
MAVTFKNKGEDLKFLSDVLDGNAVCWTCSSKGRGKSERTYLVISGGLEMLLETKIGTRTYSPFKSTYLCTASGRHLRDLWLRRHIHGQHAHARRVRQARQGHACGYPRMSSCSAIVTAL